MSNTVQQAEDFSEYNGDGTTLRRAQLRLLEMLVEFDRVCRKHSLSYFLSGGTCLGAVRHGGFIPWDDDIDVDMLHEDYLKLLEVISDELSDKYFIQTDKTDTSFARKYLRIVDKHSEVYYVDNRGRENFVYPGLWIDVLPLEKTLSYKLKSKLDYLYTTSRSHINRPFNEPLKKAVSYMLYPISWVLVKSVNLLSRRFSNSDYLCHVYGTGMAPKLKRTDCFPVKELEFEGKVFLGPANPKKYLESLYGNSFMQVPSKDKRQFHASKIIL